MKAKRRQGELGIVVVLPLLVGLLACQFGNPHPSSGTNVVTTADVAVARSPTVSPVPATLAIGPMIDDFEGGNFGDRWWSDVGEGVAVFNCALGRPGHDSAQALRLDFEVGADGYAGCGLSVEAGWWESTRGIRFSWRANRPGLSVSVGVGMEDPTQADPDAGGITPFEVMLSTPGETWTPVTLTWDELVKPAWVGEGGAVALDPARIVALNFYVEGGQHGSVWIDDLSLLGVLSDAGNMPAPTPAPTASPSSFPSPPGREAIVIDHTCTDLSKVPDHWLEEAKKLTLHYAHTSHGSQIIAGLMRLAEVNPRYSVAIQDWDPVGLPDVSGALRIYDGNNWDGDTYITPDMYWSGKEGRNRTRSVAVAGLFDFSMWSWCGQQSENDVSTVRHYLETLDQFESEFPHMRFIYMTGHTDGTSGATLARNNQLIRDYVRAHGKVLFDFADIESHDPAGRYYPNDEEGACTWCDAWCNAHPDDCTALPRECAHSDATETQRFNCKLKANAFWWMMARLAGWDGVTP